MRHRLAILCVALLLQASTGIAQDFQWFGVIGIWHTVPPTTGNFTTFQVNDVQSFAVATNADPANGVPYGVTSGMTITAPNGFLLYFGEQAAQGYVSSLVIPPRDFNGIATIYQKLIQVKCVAAAKAGNIVCEVADRLGVVNTALIPVVSVGMPVLPTVSTSDVTTVSASGATLSGDVNPNGGATMAWFEWGTEAHLISYSNTAAQSVGSGSVTLNVNQALSSLSPKRRYYYRMVAQNDGGKAWGTIKSFVTNAVPPVASTTPASEITTATATLNATMNSMGAATTAWFEWWMNSGTPSVQTTPALPIGSIAGYFPISQPLASLLPNMAYSFRVAAQNEAGTVRGATLSFTTLPAPPNVTTTSAAEILATSTIVTGSVNPQGSATYAWCEYGTSASLATYSSTPMQSIGDARYQVGVAAPLSPLAAGTRYYYRIAAQNAGGTVRGTIGTFVTLSAAVLRVPADYATIQAAVNAASPGGTILVSPGTYTGAGNKNITFGKNVTVKSAGGPDVTVLDCEAQGRAFLVNQGETSALIVDGFTLKNCLPSAAPLGYGAAVFVSHTSAMTLRNCIIEGTTQMAVQFGDQEIAGPQSRVTNTVFRNNTAGCIHSWKSPLIVDSCLFEFNKADGPALLVNYHLTNPIGQYRYCVFRYNTGSYALIDARHGWKASNCLLYDNSPVAFISNTNSSSAPNTLDHCTVVKTGFNGSLDYGPNSGLVSSSILWPWSTAAQLSVSAATVFRYSLLTGGVSGAVDGGGNIQSNPAFVDTGSANFRLAPGSPCLGTGESGSNMGVNMDLLPQSYFTVANGSLTASLSDAEGWGPIGAGARVELFDVHGNLVGTQTTDANSTVTFSHLTPGAGYYYRVYKNRATSWGEQYWGERTDITIMPGQITTVNHTHNTPYMPSWSMFVDATNEELSADQKRILPPGTRMRIELQIKNPAYPGALPVSAFGGVRFDRDRIAPFDATVFSSAQLLSTGVQGTVVMYWTTPSAPGDYSLTFAAFASSARYANSLTDGGSWIDPVLRVEGASATLPPWQYVNSGIGHSIILPLSAAPTIAGAPLVKGDYIGVFYDSSGIAACAGYELWTDSSNIALTAFGDDPTSAQKDGFTAGETFTFKIFRAATDSVFDADPVYAPVGGIVTNTNAYAANGISQLSGLTGGFVSQTIALRAGWNLVSSYVSPRIPHLDSVFNPVRADIVILKNGAQRSYIPSLAINTIGPWSAVEGYQIKMTTASGLTVRGQKVMSGVGVINLAAGWGLMPYLRETEMNASTALASVVADLVILKDQDGRAYIPSAGINMIGSMKPGQGYQVKMTKARTMQFPARIIGTGSVRPPAAAESNGTALPWTFRNTGISHTIVIPISANLSIEGVPLSVGDVLGVFYDSSGVLVCAGFETWNGSASIALAAFGDDGTTPEKDGFGPGETIRWKIWRSSDAKSMAGIPVYQSVGSMNGLVTDSSIFAVNGISAISSMTATLTSTPVPVHDRPETFVLRQNFPNPFNPSTAIRYNLPEASRVVLSVLNLLGQEVAILVNDRQEAGEYEVHFDASGLASGVYLVRMRAGEFVQSRRMLLVR